MSTSISQEHAGPVGEHVVKRIAILIPALGLAGGAIAAMLHRQDWTLGIIAGSLLAWANFLLLKRGVGAIVRAGAAMEPGATPAKVSPLTVLTALFRYGLIGGAAYAIFKYLQVPLLSIAVGLCALAAATIAASVWEILNPVE